MYFQDINKDSIKKVYLASELSKSMRIHDLRAITNSWLAHLYYNFDQYEKLAISISEVIDLTNSPNHDWIARISLTIADTLQLSGDWKGADAWYRTSQRFSTIHGDRLTLGAVIFNRTAVGLSKIRVDYALDRRVSAGRRRWITEARSAEYFHVGLSMFAQSELLLFCNARALFLENRLIEAEECYKKILKSGHSERCGVNNSFIQAEISMCAILRGKDLPEGDAAPSLHPDACNTLAMDDRLIYQTNLVEIWVERNGGPVPQDLCELVTSSIKAHRESSKALSEQVLALRPKLKDLSLLLDVQTSS